MVSRDELNRCLAEDWGQYISRFEQLSESEQLEFLIRQGYPSLKSLLAHLAAWWRVGIGVVQHHLSDPNYIHPQMDVDAFNNAVIARMEGVSLQDVLNDFESARRQMLDLVAILSDTDLTDPKINLQLLIEVVEHLEEHQ